MGDTVVVQGAGPVGLSAILLAKLSGAREIIAVDMHENRLAIARSLANRPKVLIADEPTGNLDPNTSRVVFQNLFEIAKQEGVAVLVATHNVELTSVMDRVLTLHDGRLEPAPARAD
jgi:ABC-type ATPase involved in cell division